MAAETARHARIARDATLALVCGGLMTAGGVVVGTLAFLGEIPARWSALALIVGATLELGSGLLLRRRGGAWMAEIFDAAQILGYGAFLLTAWHFDPLATTSAPVALMLGLVCLTNALFRGLALLIDRPWTLASDLVDLTVTFILAVVIFRTWRSATPSFVGLVAGVDLFVGGLCVVAVARLARRHPERSGYHGHMEHLLHDQAGQLDPKQLW